MFKSRSQAKKVTFRQIKTVDINCFKRDLSNSDLCRNGYDEFLNPKDVEKLLSVYDTTLSAVLDMHAPLKTKTVKVRTKVPWYSNDIAEAKRQRRKAERTWRRIGSPEDLARFKKKKNHVTYIFNKARKKFDTEFFEDNDGDQKKLLKATNALLQPKDDLYFPDHLHNTSLANDIGFFFHNKIENILRELDLRKRRNRTHRQERGQEYIFVIHRLSLWKDCTAELFYYSLFMSARSC